MQPKITGRHNESEKGAPPENKTIPLVSTKSHETSPCHEPPLQVI